MFDKPLINASASSAGTDSQTMIIGQRGVVPKNKQTEFLKKFFDVEAKSSDFGSFFEYLAVQLLDNAADETPLFQSVA